MSIWPVELLFMAICFVLTIYVELLHMRTSMNEFPSDTGYFYTEFCSIRLVFVATTYDFHKFKCFGNALWWCLIDRLKLKSIKKRNMAE